MKLRKAVLAGMLLSGLLCMSGCIMAEEEETPPSAAAGREKDDGKNTAPAKQKDKTEQEKKDTAEKKKADGTKEEENASTVAGDDRSKTGSGISSAAQSGADGSRTDAAGQNTGSSSSGGSSLGGSSTGGSSTGGSGSGSSGTGGSGSGGSSSGSSGSGGSSSGSSGTGSSGSGGSGTGSSGSGGSSQVPVSPPVTQIIHHPAEGHYQTVVVQEAYDEILYEEQEIFDTYSVFVCNNCGAEIGTTTQELNAHEDRVHPIDWETGEGGYSYRTEQKKIGTGTYTQVPIGTVHHDAVTTQVWVVDREAWDEVITT